MSLLVTASTADIFIQLFVAAILGALIGLERNLAGKTAGMRTHALVSLGACLFVIVAKLVTTGYWNQVGVLLDELRVLAGIITGVGFLGAGLIILKDTHLSGLTTAAGLWIAAGVGIATGYKLYAISFYTTVLVLFIFTVLWFLEQKLKRFSYAPDRKNLVTVDDEVDESLLRE